MCEQTAVVLGLARQGVALARYLSDHGVSVRASDLRTKDALEPAIEALSEYQIDFVLGEHPQSLLDDADIVFVSGGVPTDISLLQQVREQGIPLSNDSQLFLEKTPCQVVGITGSSGKSTTTLLAARIATACGRFRRVWAGGNLGNPLIGDVQRMTNDDVAIMEISSFQLEIMTASPNVAVILNITPNHLDRHGTMDEYVDIKASILDGQRVGDVAVLSWEDDLVRGLHGRVRGDCWWFGVGAEPGFVNGCHLDGDRLMLRRRGVSTTFATYRDIQLRGAHNTLNVVAAATVAASVGIDPTILPKAMCEFEGVRHRLELLLEVHEVRWINDTMSTTPERTVAALKSFTEQVILLLGGREKKLPWDTLAEQAKTGVKAIILFGESAALIEGELGSAWPGFMVDRTEVQSSAAPIEDHGSVVASGITDRDTVGSVSPPTVSSYPILIRVDGLEEAVQQAATMADAGDVVLLSPGCTSFDAFSDAAERGDRFRELVHRLS